MPNLFFPEPPSKMDITCGVSWTWNSLSSKNPSAVSVVREIHSSACLQRIRKTRFPIAKQSLEIYIINVNRWKYDAFCHWIINAFFYPTLQLIYLRGEAPFLETLNNVDPLLWSITLGRISAFVLGSQWGLCWFAWLVHLFALVTWRFGQH